MPFTPLLLVRTHLELPATGGSSTLDVTSVPLDTALLLPTAVDEEPGGGPNGGPDGSPDGGPDGGVPGAVAGVLLSQHKLCPRDPLVAYLEFVNSPDDDGPGISEEEVPFIPGVLLSTAEEGTEEIDTDSMVVTGGATLRPMLVDCARFRNNLNNIPRSHSNRGKGCAGTGLNTTCRSGRERCAGW